jgi:FkbH-like protein
MTGSPTSPRPNFKLVSELAKRGNTQEALRLLAEGLHADGLDAETCAKAGTMIAKLWAQLPGPTDATRILVLGQITTTWVASTLTALAWGRGCPVEVQDGEYDNIVQELTSAEVAEHRPNVVILLPWTHRLFYEGRDRSPEQRLAEELSYWKQVWALTAEKTRARILQVSYDWVHPGPLGHHLAGAQGDVALVRQMNEALRGALPRGSFFLDLEQVAGTMGRERFYDPRRYFWTKQPFSEIGAHRLATHLWAGVRALITGPKKVLVLDLDNTLWGGVVGETGPLGVSLGETADGEAFRAFQRYAKGLSQRGVVLAVSSKNNPEDARSPFQQNPEMILKLSDFAHFEANWEPKSNGLRRIAETLSLGLDSFVFFDDNPAEREQIRQALPEVAVVEVPEDPAEYVRALQAGLWFEAVELSSEDTQRAAQYQQESQRRELQQNFASIDDYLESLEMRGTVGPFDETNLQRVTQLLGKTNQFNTTTRRHSLEEVRRLTSIPGALGLVYSLEDKFGDHGLIAVLLAVPMPEEPEKTLRIDVWLMSCRVIGRTAEQFFFNNLVEQACGLGYQWLVGEFIPTKKNALVSDLYDRLGFQRSAEAADKTVTYRFPLREATLCKTFVRTAKPAYA